MIFSVHSSSFFGRMPSLNQRLFSNSLYLAFIQAANLGLPLLTFPYLVHVLGIKLFGVMALAASVMHYANVLIDYGFNLTATRQAALVRDDLQAVSELYASVQVIKMVLIVLCSICILIVQVTTDSLEGYTALYWYTFLGVAFSALLPVWLFQGMEQIRIVSILNVAIKFLFTIGVFLFVHSPSDYLYVPFLTMFGALSTFLISLLLVRKQFGIIWSAPSVKLVISQLTRSWYVFLSQLKVTLFSNTNIVILGWLVGPVAVGYYASAEKLMRALAQLQTPVTQSLFPQISQLMKVDRALAMVRLRSIALFGALLYGAVLLVIWAGSEWICTLIFREEGVWIAQLLRFMLPIPLCIFLNNIFGTQILLNLGRDRIFFWTLLGVAAFSLIVCSILSFYFQQLGAAWALLATELLLVSVFAWLVKDDFFKRCLV